MVFLTEVDFNQLRFPIVIDILFLKWCSRRIFDPHTLLYAFLTEVDLKEIEALNFDKKLEIVDKYILCREQFSTILPLLNITRNSRDFRGL